MNEIEWEDTVEIDWLIQKLEDAKKRGIKVVELRTFESGRGTTEDGGYEFNYTDAKICLY